jgi:hypothetical protein
MSALDFCVAQLVSLVDKSHQERLTLDVLLAFVSEELGLHLSAMIEW